MLPWPPTIPDNKSIGECPDAVLLNSLNRDRTKEETLDPIGIDGTISIFDCLGVGSVVRYARKE